MSRSLHARLWELIKPHWYRLVISMGCMAAVATSTGASAYLIQPVLDDIFINKREKLLGPICLMVLAMFIVKGASSWGQAYYMNQVGQRIVAILRESLYEHLQRLSLSFFDRTPTGVLMSRITNDVALLEKALSSAFTGLLKESFSISALLIVVYYRNWRLALIATTVLPLAFYPIVKFGRTLRRLSGESQESIGDLSVIMHETFSGNRIVKAFGMEDYENHRFRAENRRYFQYMIRSAKIRALSSPLMEFLGGIGIVLTILYGGYSVIRGTSTAGNFFSFMAAVLMLYEPVKRLSNLNNVVQQGLAAGDRIFQILDTRPEIMDEPGAVSMKPFSNTIRFRDVHFSYGNIPVLQGIDFEVRAGEIVAIVGMSGVGKTTLVNLIARFYDVTRGAILIDGVDIRRLKLASLRSQIALVTQETLLFNDSVRNNIAYGDREKSEARILEAAKAANAYQFIMAMPEGLEARVGEQGTRLSGGQRQRLCIARALLKDAPILILDEATSALDSESEREVQKALENLMEGRTTFLISHRLTAIRYAHRVLVLSQGRIVEEGTHDDLLAINGHYARLYRLQRPEREDTKHEGRVLSRAN